MRDRGLDIRGDVLKKITSAEADKVTPQLSKIFLCLASAPPPFWNGEYVLRFTERVEGTTVTTAWAQIATLVKASPRVTKKALKWLESEGLITLYTSIDGREIILSFESVSRR